MSVQSQNILQPQQQVNMQTGQFGGQQKQRIDPSSNLEEFPISDANMKNYNVFVADASNTSPIKGFNFRLAYLFHYKKHQNFKNININDYFTFSNGKLIAKRTLTTKKIYDIAKKILEDVYLLVLYDSNGREVVVPTPKWVVEAVFKNGAKIELNSSNHIERVVDKDGNIINPPTDDIETKMFNFFSKNVSCDFPYAYGHMAIRKRTLNYRFTKRNKKGGLTYFISQNTNELIGTSIKRKKAQRMTRFFKKIRKAWLKTRRLKNRTYVFTGSYPLPKEQHMVSFCLVVKNNKMYCYMINSNGWSQAHDRYALPLKRSFEKYINKVIPEMAEKVNYRYVNQSAQRGPTCMTHADYITRKLAKDPNFDFDGSGVHPMKICFLALQRALAVDGIYRVAKKQKHFSPDNIDKVEKNKHKVVENTSPVLDKNKRNFFIQNDNNVQQNQNNTYQNTDKQLNNNDAFINKNDRNNEMNVSQQTNGQYIQYNSIPQKQIGVEGQNSSIGDYYQYGLVKRPN